MPVFQKSDTAEEATESDKKLSRVIFIEGGSPLMGQVTLSGSRNSASKLIIASLFSNEDVTLNNVPRTGLIEELLDTVRSIGGIAEWTGSNRLVMNGSQISSHEVPPQYGSKNKTAILLAGVLLYRFNKAIIPKYFNKEGKTIPINRLVNTWKTFGVDVEENENWLSLSTEKPISGNIVFKTSTHMGTDNAIISSVFIEGETIIHNASEEIEIEDLINMLNQMGAQIERIEPRTIKVIGTNIFKSTRYDVQPDKNESAIFATAAVLTNGNVLIKGLAKEPLIPFVNFLNKINVRFEFSGDELKVWRHDDTLNPTSLTISPTPGFISDWQSYATLLLTQADGESTVHDTVYTDRFDYVNDLNRMSADIDLMRPSEVGIVPVISNDDYNFETMGEPKTVAKIKGPSKLKGSRFIVDEKTQSVVLILASLCAEGKSEIIGIENMDFYHEGLLERFRNLGANIWEQ